MRWIIASIVAVSLSLPTYAQDLVIKAAKVYTQTGAPLSPGAVRIRDGKIAEVATEIKIRDGGKVIDLGQGCLMPGLIDAFTSIGIDGGIAESTREITPNFRVSDGIDWNGRQIRFARSDGVTTVSLVPGSDNVIAGLSTVVKTAGLSDRRVLKKDHSLVITTASDPASGNNSRSRPDSIYNRQPTNRMGVIWMLRNEFHRAKSAESGPVHEVLNNKRPVTCLSRLDSDILAALRLRSDYPMNLTIAGGHEAYRVRTELAANKIPVLLGKLATTAGTGPEQTDAIFNNAGLLYEAGVTFALSGGQLLEQARFASRNGLPKEIALAAITSTPAKLLGVESRVGTIAVGKDADLVALTGDPLEFTTAVRWTMCDGVLRPEDQ